MTQPTGDHASGVKLASAYVEVDAHTRDGMKEVHDQLTGVETHAKQVGENSAQNIVTAMGTAGEPAAKGFMDKFSAFAQDRSKAAADVTTLSFGDAFKEGLRRTRLVDDIDWVFNGFKEKSSLYGQEAASSFTKRMGQLFVASREDVAAEAEKTGSAAAQGVKRGAESAGEGFGLSESFKKASEGLHGLGSQMGEAGAQAGGLGDKLGSIAGPLAMFASPAVLGAGAVLGFVGALGLAVDKVYELGEQWEDLGHKIEIQTGATGARLEGLKDQVKGVYGSVTNSMGDVENVVSVVNTAFKDTGAGAQAVSKQIENLQAMVGQVDVTTLGTAFRGFNIGGDAKQQQSVIDGLLKTSQDSRVPVQELIASLQRLAPIADQAHLGMKDTVAMLDQFAQAGIKPQQTMFMLAHASSEATKEGKDFRTVLQDNINAIRNAPNEQEAEKIAKGIAGPTSGRGGAALLAQAVRGSGQLNLDPGALGRLENWDGLVNKTRQDTMTWGDQWTLFKHKVSDALEPTSTMLHEKVAGVMVGLVDFLGQHQAGITAFVTSLVDGFEKGSTAIGNLVKESLPGIKAAIDYMKPAFEGMEPSLRKLGTALAPLAEALGRDIVPIVKALGEALIWALTEGMKAAPPAIEKLTTIIHVVTDIANFIHDHLYPILRDDFQAGVEKIDLVVDAFKDVVKWAGEGYDAIKKIIEAIGKIHVPHIDLPHLSGGGPPVHAQSGMGISGYGGGDIVPAMLEPGEHVVTKEEVSAVGGQQNMYLIRQLMRHGLLQQVLGFDNGGDVPSIAPWDTGGASPQRVALPPTALTGATRPDEGHKQGMERTGKGVDLLSQGHTGADVAIKGGRVAEGAEKLGQWGTRLAGLAEVAEPWSKALGLVALPWDALGAVNWGLNAVGKVTGQQTNLSPVERMQQWWYNFSEAPKQYAAHGHQHGVWDQWRAGYKGTTPQNIHIPGTNTNVADVGKSAWNWLSHSSGGAIQHFASGGMVHPASGGGKEKGWVIDRFNLAKPKPLHFQDGGGVAGYGGLTDVKAMLAAQSGRTPYVFGGYSPAGVDCSGLVAEAVELYLGEPMSGGHPMSTGNEASWLAAHGFQQGTGPEGSFRVGFYNGGPGGGHTALTLPDGTNAESGGSGGGVRLGGGAAGANSSEFTEHWFLPPRSVVSPMGWSGGGGAGSGGYGGAGGGSGASGGGGGFGGTGGGGGGMATPPTAGQTTKYNDDLVKSQDRVADATKRVTEAQAKLDADRANPKKKPEEIARDEDRLAEAKERLAESQSSLQELQAKPPEGKAAKGAKGGDDFTGMIGDTLMKGFGDNLPQGFSNPLEWGGTKSASALLKFFGNILGGQGGAAAKSLVGDGSEGGGASFSGGQVSPYVQGLIAQVPGYQGAGNSGGGQNVNVTHNAYYSGSIHDGHQHTQAKLAADKRTTSKTLGRWVMA